jgi:hypothetical protein
MAVTEITPQTITLAGLTPAYASANSDGSKVKCSSDERMFVQLKNTNGSTRTITFDVPNPTQQLAGWGPVTLADPTVTVPITTGDKMIGPLPPALIDADGFVNFTFDAVADLTIAVFKLARRA